MSISKWTKWVLLDWDGTIIRWFDYPATGSVRYKEPKVDITKFEECLF